MDGATRWKNFRNSLRHEHVSWSPFAAIAGTTFFAIVVSIYSLLSGWTIIFQNLLYIPIVIACVHYVEKGFAFSVALSLVYLLLITALAGDGAVILQASIRTFIFVGIAGIITFLSLRRRKVEEELREHRGNLEKLVEERTAELKQTAEQARQRQEELLYVSRLRTLGEMASGLAHELNQPLSAILSYASASRAVVESQDADRERLMRNLEQVISQSKRAGEIIKRVRALAQRRPVRLGPVDVNEAVREVLAFLRLDMVHQEIQVALELGEDLPAVLSDAIQLQQVLLNLMRNALEAMETTDPTERQLTVRTCVATPGIVKVTVSDTGAGLDPTLLPRIFEPFFTTKAQGLGIGLSIAHSIVEMHRGQLSVEPGPARGCTFAFTLPAVPEDSAVPGWSGSSRRRESPDT